LIESTPANEISLVGSYKKTLSKCRVDPLKAPPSIRTWHASGRWFTDHLDCVAVRLRTSMKKVIEKDHVVPCSLFLRRPSLETLKFTVNCAEYQVSQVSHVAKISSPTKSLPSSEKSDPAAHRYDPEPEQDRQGAGKFGGKRSGAPLPAVYFAVG
jgi:hypothetical protein